MEQITPLDLITWQSGWSDENSTRRNRRDTIKSFFKFCVNAELIKSNPSHAMPTIKEVRTDRKPFEPAEMEAVFRVLPDFADEYGRKGQAIAQQVDAFVHVMRYTGLDCSTLVKLEKSHVYVNEGKIMTYRQKTGSDVTVPVPDWVLAKLMACPHDSEKYFFWSGEGELHTRATKWFTRIRKLLNLAGLKERTAHNFRHTYAVELLIAGTPISDVARLLGHAKVSTTEKHYAMWVKRRTDALHDQVRRTWANDALHVQHSSVPPSDAPSPQRVN